MKATGRPKKNLNEKKVPLRQVGKVLKYV